MSGRRRLYLSLVIVCFAACRPYPAADQQPSGVEPLGQFPCLGSGWKNKQGPYVCVDSKTLNVDPDPVRIHDHKKEDKNKPVTIQWFTSSGGGDLKIEMNKEGCLENVNCPSRGYCRAESNLKGKGKDCKYTVILDGNRKDPTVIVDQCCM